MGKKCNDINMGGCMILHSVFGFNTKREVFKKKLVKSKSNLPKNCTFLLFLEHCEMCYKYFCTKNNNNHMPSANATKNIAVNIEHFFSWVSFVKNLLFLSVPEYASPTRKQEQTADCFVYFMCKIQLFVYQNYHISKN